MDISNLLKDIATFVSENWYWLSTFVGSVLIRKTFG